MTEARSYKCPSCGGEVDEQARRCGYCGAPIATVRCANCYHMNVPDAAHCSGCGRQLGLEPIGEPDELSCPHCETHFEAFAAGPGRLHDCPRCGGQFVEHALLRDLLERREVYGVRAPRPQAVTRATEPVRYVPCPACGTLMNRKNFGRTSGVIVDVCHQHGIWFDAGELPRVIEFVESGGLQRAQRREAAERTLSREHQAETASVLPALDATSVTHITDGPDLFDDLADAGSALLGYLATLVKKE